MWYEKKEKKKLDPRHILGHEWNGHVIVSTKYTDTHPHSHAMLS